MRVVQWNTHHGGVGSDGKLNVLRLAAAIVKLNPDIICLNELEHFNGYGNTDQLEMIRSFMSHELNKPFTAKFCHIGGSITYNRGQGNGIITSFPDAKWLGKGLYKNRSVISGQLAPVDIYGLHTDNESAINRSIQLSQVLRFTDSLNPEVFCGDYNCQYNSVEIAPWYFFYKDAWIEAKKLGIAKAFNGTGNTRSSRIDYVFYRGLELLGVEVPDTRINGVFPSDHHPVVVDFK